MLHTILHTNAVFMHKYFQWLIVAATCFCLRSWSSSGSSWYFPCMQVVWRLTQAAQTQATHTTICTHTHTRTHKLHTRPQAAHTHTHTQAAQAHTHKLHTHTHKLQAHTHTQAAHTHKLNAQEKNYELRENDQELRPKHFWAIIHK